MVNMCNFLGWTTYLKSYMVFQKDFTKLNESCMFTFDLDTTDELHVRYTFYGWRFHVGHTLRKT